MFVVWMRCNCYVWPISPVNTLGRCKRCGVKPHTQHDNQDEPTARPLTDDELATTPMHTRSS